MKPKNLISVYQGATALDSIEPPVDKKFKTLKRHEIRNLNSFCNIMQELGCTLSAFDGYYVGYSIGQIGKEFDLLRFGDELIINIEIKSELKVANKEEKILKQMRVNHYYLKFLGKKRKIFTYVENDGFYEYEEELDILNKIDGQVVAAYMREHIVNYGIDPDKEFVPSKVIFEVVRNKRDGQIELLYKFIVSTHYRNHTRNLSKIWLLRLILSLCLQRGTCCPRACTTPPPELQSNQPETQNTSRPGAVKHHRSRPGKFLTTYSATVGGGPHGKPVDGEF